MIRRRGEGPDEPGGNLAGAGTPTSKEVNAQELAGFAWELDKNLRAQDPGTAEGRLDEGVTLTLDVKGISQEAVQLYVDDFVRKMQERGRQLLVEIRERA